MRRLFIFSFFITPFVWCGSAVAEVATDNTSPRAEAASSAEKGAPLVSETPLEVPRPEYLLAQLSLAIKARNYSGEFTYEHGSQLESYRLVHQIVDGEERESLQSLTGKDTTLSRLGVPECGTIGRHLLAGASLSSSGGDYYGIDRFYQASVLGRDRIAGREAWLLQLLPRDEHRFGLMLAVDQETSLLLRHVVFDARKKVALERTQFVSLNLGESEMSQSVDIKAPKERCINKTYSPSGHSPWKPHWLPPGFILTGYEYHKDDGYMETYTDGIFSFSVFVKPGSEGVSEGDQIQQGVSSRGASMALITSRMVGGQMQHISVVGEIPLSSAQKVALSVRQASTTDANGS